MSFLFISFLHICKKKIIQSCIGNWVVYQRPFLRLDCVLFRYLFTCSKGSLVSAEFKTNRRFQRKKRIVVLTNLWINWTFNNCSIFTVMCMTNYRGTTSNQKHWVVSFSYLYMYQNKRDKRYIDYLIDWLIDWLEICHICSISAI